MKGLLVLTLVSGIALNSYAGPDQPYAHVTPGQGGYYSEESNMTPMNDGFVFPGYLMTQSYQIIGMLYFYGITGYQNPKLKSPNFFGDFFYPHSATVFYRSASTNQFGQWCKASQILKYPTNGQAITYACTDEYNSTFVDPIALKRFPTYAQGLAMIKARLLGWCQLFGEMRKILPYTDCSDAFSDIEFVLRAIKDIKVFYNKRNIESADYYNPHFQIAEGEDEAVQRLKNAFGRLGIK